LLGTAVLAAVLTLNDALRIFRERGFDLAIANASIASAQGDVTIAGAVANPSLSLGRESPRGIDAGITDQAAISDAVSGKRNLRIAVARAALDATRYSRDDVERTLELALKQQVLQAELAKRALEFARESQNLNTETLALVNTRYSAGAVSEADVARAEVQKLEAEQAVEVAQQTYAVARANVAYLLGDRDTPADLDFADELTHSAKVADASRDTLLDIARAHRPDLAASRMQVERAETAVTLARRLRVPDFFPSLQYSQQTVTLSVSAAPPLLYRYRGELAKAEADLRTQQTTVNKIDAQIGADVSSAYAALTSAHDRVARMEDRLLARAARARDLVRLQYEKGAASLFEYLDAQRTFLGTRNEYLQNLNDYWTAVFELEQATGTELHQ